MKFTNFVVVLLCCLFGFAMVNSAAIPDENQNNKQSLIMNILEKVNFNKKLTVSEKKLLCKASEQERHVVSLLYCIKNKNNNGPFQEIVLPHNCSKKLELRIKNVCKN